MIDKSTVTERPALQTDRPKLTNKDLIIVKNQSVIEVTQEMEEQSFTDDK